MPLPTKRLFPVYVRQGRSRAKYKAGFINVAGETIVPPVYENAQPFYNGFASICLQEKWGTIDLSGEIVITPTYSGPLTFNEGLTSFSVKSGKLGLVNIAGDICHSTTLGNNQPFQ